jgi:hypothetical protein
MEEGTGAVEVKGAVAPAKKAPVGPDPNIVRGRMPIAVVAQIRFGNDKAEKAAMKAALYGTTVGKIVDVEKSANFAYVTATFKPTQAMIDEGIAYLKKHPKYNEGFVDKQISELEKTTVATEAEAAAFADVRKANRGQATTKKDGTPAAAGGGNNRGKKKEKAAPADAAVAGQAAPADAAVAGQAASAADLLK